MNNIRNFSIIAHIDHGKSTLSDRLIQICGGLSEREMNYSQVLDTMDLERERGITIKAQSVTLKYKSYNNKIFQLNLIDTPGHVDFSHEVFRSLSACEGALLVIDSGKNIESQTLSNYYIALEMNLKIILVLNKIDLFSSDPNRILQQIKDIMGINEINAVYCSAKTGLGIPNLLERIVKDIPPPKGNSFDLLQALIIDSWFDNYFGVVLLICIKNGTLYKNDKIKIINTDKYFNIERLGIFTPKRTDKKVLNCGEVGWIICSIKNISGSLVGKTLTHAKKPSKMALPCFKKTTPQVYSGLFPINSNDYKSFRNALNKLSLNDASLFYEPESSITLGFGFRCGFLGLLHMEIIQERIEREYNIKIITTIPTVSYEVLTKDNNILYIDNPSKLQILNNISEIREPIAECHILLPKIYLGKIITLCVKKRGIQTNITYYNNKISLTYDIPMSEIILDFFNKLKSISHGYASLEYKFKYFKKSDIVRTDILINNKCIDAMSLITHRNNALLYGRNFVNKIKKLIQRHQFDIIIQATINNHVIARSTIKRLRKNVIEKCYGGDVSRKKKLLQKQKKGKERMKKIGNVIIPQEVFLSRIQLN